MTREEFLKHTIVMPNGCREWLGQPTVKGGYGQVKVQGVQWSAHRLAWVLFRGPIPQGKLICHKCNNPICVETEGKNHLYVGTHQTNHDDMMLAGTRPRGNIAGWTPLEDADILELVRRWKAGEKRTVLARQFGIRYGTLINILRGQTWGWLTGLRLPKKKRAWRHIKITWKGRRLSPQEWAKVTGIPRRTIYMRFRCGWDPESILMTVGRAKHRIGHCPDAWKTSPSFQKHAGHLRFPSLGTVMS